LYSRSGSTVLQVADDGVGFDPAILTRRVSEGHIGLASLVVAVEATGGAMDFAEQPGGGTLVTVSIPDELHEG
jgi:two-component system NarL family sensor kinase